MVKILSCGSAAGPEGPARNGVGRSAGWELPGTAADGDGGQLLEEVSAPPAIFSHVPLGTLSQASVWAVFLDVPAQDEVAVWQSFLPALAMPKHFSVEGAWAWT